MKAKVIIRQQDELLKNQVDLLNVYFGTNGWERLNIPSEGWTLQKQIKLSDLQDELEDVTKVVFASSLPVLIGKLVYVSAYYDLVRVWVLHNDEKKHTDESSTDEIIFTGQNNWKLVEI
ncbi:MAG: hypothetical protein E7F17_03370 [Clostridium perfringens]|uniref:hypothetical protein n=1 Tax=Clostridium perfringens TaxID=1502 RepID=UPI000B382448|nr:hypothetical protein [Clostridium perfringens]EGT0691018.1 hypothetical protein [Clostridium perfringens]EGT0694182.1 hypothetical protein [Clostridium perfringens]EGT0696545.1 hypothetical protein [Clostridium perfringens]MDU3376206.1 hypothetical protein [Clostridium perfringens]MDU3534162.1 hypothetical protein [Clostridium perfringens]